MALNGVEHDDDTMEGWLREASARSAASPPTLVNGRRGVFAARVPDNRLFVDAVLYRDRTGIPWRDLRRILVSRKTRTSASMVPAATAPRSFGPKRFTQRRTSRRAPSIHPAAFRQQIINVAH